MAGILTDSPPRVPFSTANRLKNKRFVGCVPTIPETHKSFPHIQF